jgi:hypothetical protein
MKKSRGGSPPILPYSAACPKCKATVAGKGHCRNCKQYPGGKDHLHCICADCGFSWTTACADARPAKRTNPRGGK